MKHPITLFIITTLLLISISGCELELPALPTWDNTATEAPSLSTKPSDAETLGSETTTTEPAGTETTATEPVTTQPVQTEPVQTEPEPTGCAHSYTEKILTAPTCTEGGTRERSCSLCGDTQQDALPAAGHSFSDWAVVKAATCTDAGSQSRSCSVCKLTEEEALKPAGHVFGENTVTVIGSCTEDGESTQTCTVCNFTEVLISHATGHKYTDEVLTAATCTEAGQTRRTCSRCGGTETVTVSAKGHSYGSYTTLSEATCTASGKRTAVCKTCGQEITEDIPATGHAYGDGVLVKSPVSCGEPGLRRYTCGSCGDSYDKEIAGAHTLGETYRYRANLYRDCTVCGFQIHDLYTEGEPQFSDCDPKAALNTDVIKLKFTEYTGPLATWPERWIKYIDYFQGVIQDRMHDLPADPEFYIYDLEYTDLNELLADLLACREAFYEVFGWMPAKPYIAEEDGWSYITMDVQAHYQSFREASWKLSEQRREEIVNDLVAYHVLSSGVWDGMQAYNAIGHLHDRLVYKMVRYDENLSLHTPYQGLTGGSCVCSGYAQIFKRMLQFCGIQCDTVVGTMVDMGHEWNVVTFSDGTVRYVDATNFSYRYLVLVPDYVLKYMDEYKW